MLYLHVFRWEARWFVFKRILFVEWWFFFPVYVQTMFSRSLNRILFNKMRTQLRIDEWRYEKNTTTRLPRKKQQLIYSKMIWWKHFRYFVKKFFFPRFCLFCCMCMCNFDLLYSIESSEKKSIQATVKIKLSKHFEVRNDDDEQMQGSSAIKTG